MNDEQIIEGVRRWLENMVIGLELCPFARKPFDEGTLDLEVSRAETAEDVYADLVGAIERFLLADPGEHSTALYVCPDALPDFADFNDFLAGLQDGLVQTGLDAMIQVIGFHPGYRFDGADPDDPANYTNRSPCPLFHMIRQQEMRLALDHHPNPAAIPARNISFLRRLGTADLEARLRAFQQGARDRTVWS